MVATTLISSLVLAGQAGVTFRYQPPLNHPYRYRMVTDLQQTVPGVGAMPMKTTTEMTMTAVSRSGDKTTVATEVIKAKVDVPANSPMAAQKSQTEQRMKGVKGRMVMGSDFKIVGGKAGMPGMSMGMSGMPSMSFPNHPVRVGETWKSNLDLAKMMGGGMMGMKMNGNIPINFRLVSVTGSGASRVARIEMKMKGVMNMSGGAMNMSTNLNSTSLLDMEVATGMTRNMKMVMDSTINVGKQNMKQHMTMTMAKM